MNIEELINEWWNTLEFYLTEEEMEEVDKDKVVIFQYLEKLKKTIEIITEELIVTVSHYKNKENKNIYQLDTMFCSSAISKKKYKLLKEMLKNDSKR